MLFAEQYALCDGWLTLRQGMGPGPAFGMAGKAFCKRLNEINVLILADDDHAALPRAGKSVYSALLDYVGTTMNIGAQIVQKVLFGGIVSNLRITHQSGFVYDVPQGTPYFESSHGLVMAGADTEDMVLPLIGKILSPGWRTALEKHPDNDLLAMLQLYRDDQPVYLLNFFAPARENLNKYMQLALRLFPHLLMCRTAMVGPLETHSLAVVLQSEFLSQGSHPVYSQGRQIAPMKVESRLQDD